MNVTILPITDHTPDEINVPHRVEIPELRWIAVERSAADALSRAYLAVLAHRGASSTDPSFTVTWAPALYERDTADGDVELYERRVEETAPLPETDRLWIHEAVCRLVFTTNYRTLDETESGDLETLRGILAAREATPTALRGAVTIADRVLGPKVAPDAHLEAAYDDRY